MLTERCSLFKQQTARSGASRASDALKGKRLEHTDKFNRVKSQLNLSCFLFFGCSDENTAVLKCCSSCFLPLKTANVWACSSHFPFKKKYYSLTDIVAQGPCDSLVTPLGPLGLCPVGLLSNPYMDLNLCNSLLSTQCPEFISWWPLWDLPKCKTAAPSLCLKVYSLTTGLCSEQGKPPDCCSILRA